MDKKKVKRALEDKPEPTPGFILDEIAAMTFEGIDVCEKLSTFLVGQLQKNDSPHILAKALKVMRAVCEKGHPDFKKDVQRQVDKLRTCATFRGKPDPIHGDRFNQLVREAATQAIEASFAANKSPAVQGGTRTKDLSGQGSNTVDPKGGKQGFQTGISVSGSTGGNTYVSAVTGAVSSFTSAAYTGFGYFKPTEREQDLTKYASNQFNTDQQYIAPSRNIVSAPTSSPTVEQKMPELVPSYAPVLISSEPVKPELLLVDKVMKSKQELTRHVCNDFINQTLKLDVKEICGCLDDFLDEKQQWQTRFRALSLIEYIVNAQIPDALLYFREHPEDVMRNTQVVQETVKEKAVKILGKVGVKAPTERQYVTQVQSDSLFGDLQWKSPVQATNSSPPSANSLSFDDLLKTPDTPESINVAVAPKAPATTASVPKAAVGPPTGGKIKTRATPIMHSPRTLGSQFPTSEATKPTLFESTPPPPPAPKPVDIFDELFS